jgi:hypothetical protein
MGARAIVRQELTRLARRRSHYVTRAILALATLYVGGAVAFFGSNAVAQPGGPALADLLRFGPEIAERAFLELTWAQLLAILLFVPGLAADSIAEEDQCGTMADLLASPLRGSAIILGKLVGRIVQAGVILLVGLPVVVPALLLGLLTPFLVVQAWFMLAATGLQSRVAIRMGIALLFEVMLVPFVEPIRHAFTEWSKSWVESITADWRRWQLNESLRSVSTAFYLVGLLAVSAAPRRASPVNGNEGPGRHWS